MTSGVYERTQETRAILSAARLGKHFSPHSQKTRDAISQAHTDVPLTPEHCALISEAKLGVPLSPEHKAAISKGHAESDIMRGGDDIVWHHTLYDHVDLSKNRVPMTRRNHTMGHNVLQILGIEIPHINVKEVRTW